MGGKGKNKKYNAFPLKMIGCLVVRDSGVGLEWIFHQDVNRFQKVRNSVWLSELNHCTFRGHRNPCEVSSQTKNTWTLSFDKDTDGSLGIIIFNLPKSQVTMKIMLNWRVLETSIQVGTHLQKEHWDRVCYYSYIANTCNYTSYILGM